MISVLYPVFNHHFHLEHHLHLNICNSSHNNQWHFYGQQYVAYILEGVFLKTNSPTRSLSTTIFALTRDL